jgi:hypothetical protein
MWNRQRKLTKFGSCKNSNSSVYYFSFSIFRFPFVVSSCLFFSAATIMNASLPMIAYCPLSFAAALINAASADDCLLPIDSFLAILRKQLTYNRIHDRRLDESFPSVPYQQSQG